MNKPWWVIRNQIARTISTSSSTTVPEAPGGDAAFGLNGQGFGESHRLEGDEEGLARDAMTIVWTWQVRLTMQHFIANPKTRKY